MKWIATLASLLFCAHASATVDVQGQATIVVENYHTGDYFLQTVPVDYCIGVPTLTLATAITMPVNIKSNYGCGHDASMIQDTQVNAATCAVLTAEEVSADNGDLLWNQVRVTKDLSGCGDKAKNTQFVETLDRAIYNTYNSTGIQVIELK